MFSIIIKYFIIFVLIITICGFNFILKLYNYHDEYISSSKSTRDVYDFIIVGAGTAGLTIASSNISEYGKILLIEAGGNSVPYLMDIPVISPLLHRTNYDWNYETIPQNFSCGLMKNSKCILSSGKGIGGSNLLNNMIYSRGNSEDYKHWFSDEDLDKYFEYAENILQPIQLNYISQLGMSFEDYKNDEILFEPPLLNQRSGRRYTIAEYFKEKYNYKNIEILSYAVVTKILEDKSSECQHSIEYKKNNKIYKVKASRGIILSAGSIGTPKILLQSGYGPCDELKEIGINCVRSIPGIGKNLQDHVAIGMDLIKLNQSLGYTPLNLINPINLFKYFFNVNQGGILSTVGCELIGITENRKIGFMIIPTSVNSDYGLKLKNIMNFDDIVWEEYFADDTNKISILPILLHPKSTGEIKLRDGNPDSAPLINPNYLTHSEDIDNMLNGIKLLKTFLKLSGLQKLNATLEERKIFGCEMYKEDSDNYWKCYIKKNSFSIYHPVGTCKMAFKGQLNDITNVVDTDFSLKDSKGIYIVDASVMPNLPSKNPNGAVQMMAFKFLNNFLKELDSRDNINNFSDSIILSQNANSINGIIINIVNRTIYIISICCRIYFILLSLGINFDKTRGNLCIDILHICWAFSSIVFYILSSSFLYSFLYVFSMLCQINFNIKYTLSFFKGSNQIINFLYILLLIVSLIYI